MEVAHTIAVWLLGLNIDSSGPDRCYFHSAMVLGTCYVVLALY